jgi:hypothetical protein
VTRMPCGDVSGKAVSAVASGGAPAGLGLAALR